MENANRTGLRELQIAQGLVALRWAAIPILFGFGLLTTRVLGMSFQITPIYLLSCVLAILNVFFTIHISMLSRQLALKRGSSSLRRFLMTLVSRSMRDLRVAGVQGLFRLPRAAWKVSTSIYLMVLEALKGVRFNLLSLENVMHTQVITDILLIILFVRYTGSAESPLLILSVIPIIVAGAVLGFFHGGMYAVLTGVCYPALTLLVNFRFLMHIKFYGPEFGDLSPSLGWSVSSFLILVVALLGTAYLAHSLTSIFKERIFFLNQLLERNRRDTVAQQGVAENVPCAWFILDPQGIVIRYKRGRSGLIPNDLTGTNILERFPAFKQYGMGYVMQSVLTGGRSREIERIRLASADGTIHTLSCRLLPITDSDNRSFVLLVADDITELLFLKERTEELKQALDTSRIDFEKIHLEGKEANQQLMKSLKLANERAVEIEVATQKLKELDQQKGTLEGEISALKTEIAAVKASNDALYADLTYKQTILEELTELLRNCSQLDTLSGLIERRTKALFKLDNTCLHIFRSPPSPSRMTEILDTRKASPRLLDLPRKNPKVLEPVLNDGQPVVIKAEVHPEKGASMAISKGPLHRMVAYIPVRHGKDILGMMMLERYGPEENPEKMLGMLTYYLAHTAIALKNAMAAKDSETQRQGLTSTISSLEGQIESLTELICTAREGGNPSFTRFIAALGRLTGASDGSMVRLHNDGSHQVLGRIDPTQAIDLRPLEEKVMKTLRANPTVKATVKETTENLELVGFPLSQGNRLVGALFLQFADGKGCPAALAEVGAKLATDHLSLAVLNEEKDLWENFYKENLTA